MIVAAILNYQRKNSNPLDLAPQGVDKVLEIDQKGIGAACNKALHYAFEIFNADYCLLLANDIQEPQNSIEARLKEFQQRGAGIVTIPTDRQTQKVHKYLAGNFMISKECFNKIGYFTTEWDNSYGAVDLNYTVRATEAGFKCINAPAQAKHLDNGDTAYGFSKKQALKETWPKFKEWERIKNKSLYLPYYNKSE